MNTAETGNICVGAVMAALIRVGKVVLLPVDYNCRYDLAIDENGKFVRIQCKAGKIDGGVIQFNTSSTNRKAGKWEQNGYVGQAEFFGVYCQGNGKTYLVPVGDVGNREASLRLSSPKNNQRQKVRWAEDYEIKPL